MFIPVALGLLGSNGKDLPLSSVYHDGKLESFSNNGEPVHTTVLRVTKVSVKLSWNYQCVFCTPNTERICLYEILVKISANGSCSIA